MGVVVIVICIVLIVWNVSKRKRHGENVKAFKMASQSVKELDRGDAENLADYVVLDVETTGLDPSQEKIIEVAAIKVKGGNEIGRYETLVNPRKNLPPRITDLTGIRPEQLKNAKPYNEMSLELSGFIEGLPIVAHNSQFDAQFVSNAFALSGIQKNICHVDTVKLAKKAFPNMSNYKLNTLIHSLNLSESSQTHRAMDDVLCTRKLYNLCQQTIQAKRMLSAEIEQANKAVDSLSTMKSSVDIFLAYEQAARAISEARDKDASCAEIVFGSGKKYLEDAFWPSISSAIEKEFNKEKAAIQRLKTRKSIDNHIERFVKVFQSNEEKLSNTQKGKVKQCEQDLSRVRDMIAPEQKIAVLSASNTRDGHNDR